MVILYFLRWFNIILFLRFLFQPGRLCTKLGFFVYYYLPYCYLHQTQENENVRTIKEGKIILKIALRLWSYVLDFLFSNPIVWSYCHSQKSCRKPYIVQNPKSGLPHTFFLFHSCVYILISTICYVDFMWFYLFIFTLKNTIVCHYILYLFSILTFY